MATVNKLPADYVDFLCHPGLKTNAGNVSLQRYMSLNKGNQEINALFNNLVSSGIKDTDSHQSAKDVMPDFEWKIMWKGQGYHTHFVALWNWMWDNQEQMRDGKNAYLRDTVYNKYFRDREKTGVNPFQAMVRDHYFGIECIGFVSDYLRYVGVWNSYKGAANHQWATHFQDPVRSLDDIRPLDLLEFEDVGHIALVDKVHWVLKGKCVLDISQCSGYPKAGAHAGFNGPMKSQGAYLTDSGVGDEGQKLFTLGGDVPIAGRVQVRRMKGLVYSGGD